MEPIRTQGFELTDWQRQAVDRWWPKHKGTLEIFTGGGKTKIALSCAAQASAECPGLRLAVVVPTEALAHQWRSAIAADTDIPASEIGLLGAGKKDNFSDFRVLVCVVNTAATALPKMAGRAQPLMLIVDECHRAGAATFSKVLDTKSEYRLGLSATPERDETDEFGEPIAFDEQIVGQKVGPVVFRFTLKDARNAGWLPKFQIHHHGVELRPAERRDYEDVSRRLDDLTDRMRNMGIDPNAARRLLNQPGDVGDMAKLHIGLTSKRKDLLYRATERSRVVGLLLAKRLREGPRPRILLFHERVDEAIALHASLVAEFGGRTDAPLQLGLEHSRLPDKERRAVLDGFRAGSIDVLVSVKSLIEGIDVPEADVGVSVASSSSVRQRIQALGRVLRRRRGDSDGEQKVAEMHVVYVADSVDDLIYSKEDWSDLTGAEANSYWRWPLEAPEPLLQPGPPRTPLPTEEQAWEAIEAALEASPLPQPWPGLVPSQEYSVDTLGTVSNAAGAIVGNPQGVAEMVTRVRGRPGGRFYVTPQLRLVVIWGEGGSGLQPFVAGRLAEPFEVRALDAGSTTAPVDLGELKPGDRYPGPTDKALTLQLRQKHGGIIEKSLGKGQKVFAESEGSSAQAQAARALLSAWRSQFDHGMQVFVNSQGHAWVLVEGEPRYLADVSAGLQWPPSDDSEQGGSC